MIQEKWNERMATICVEVVNKPGYEMNEKSVAGSSRSGVTNAGVSNASSAAPNAEGIGETCTSPAEDDEERVVVDWAILTIIPEADEDGDTREIADEELLYVTMGFKAADERAEKVAREEIPIPAMPSDLHTAMDEAAIPVDDRDPTEPVMDWDRENPDMSVGTHYPCMDDLRLAVRHHAIVNEFELGTKKSDKSRFRGYCKAAGCPWKIRAKTQHDKSVRVLFLSN